MNKTALPRVAVGLLFILYPAIVYFGLQQLQPVTLALLLVIIAAVRAISLKHTSNLALPAAIAALIVLVVTTSTRGALGLYLYPLMINFSLFVLFAVSLFNPPTVIEQIAAKQHGQLPAEAVAYTRKVTQAWCIFFVANGLLSILSLRISEAAWALYNGLISYLLIALILGGEYLIRRKVMASHGH